MRGFSVRVAMAVLLGGLLIPPAAATNWFSLDSWIWVDLDSVKQSGDVVTFTVAHTEEAYVAPGPNASRWIQAINCRTLQANSASSTWATRPDHPMVVRYCPKREAAQPVKPALTPAKPLQGAAPKAQSDLKVCETYTPDKKARVAACTRIIESKNPGFADLVSAHHNRCFARVIADEKAEAVLPDCDRAVTLDPKSFEAFRTRGLVNNIAGRPDAAIADFTQAIALNRKDWQVYANRAQVYLRKKDLQKAIADITTERSVNQSSSEASFRDRLCWARVSLNVELETALSDCESVVRLEPKGSYSYEGRGLVRLRMGKLKDARADADKALALDKKNARALYLRALVNAREGKTMASYGDYAAATKTQEGIAKQYDDIGLKLMVQAETAPFCPAMTALIKAASERAASTAKADVALPGATYCDAVDRGYWCTWETGPAQAAAKQKAMATSAAACLVGYTRKDSAGATGPAAEFASGKTKVTVGTMYELKSKSIVAAGVAVTIAK